VIREHVVQPLEESAIANSCFAAAMLIFAAIDGLGKLQHPSAEAKPNERFKLFITRLGPPYRKCAAGLWNLRCSLDHNAMNVACFMSKTVEARAEHLEEYKGFLFIHTGRLLEDFKTALEQFDGELQTDDNLLQQAESRLGRDYITPKEWRRGVAVTTPPAIWFVQGN
jgi:hypothetical protein